MKCPFCAEQIQDEATTCRYCGKLLAGHPRALQAAYQRMAQDTEREGAALEWAEAMIGDDAGESLVDGRLVIEPVAEPELTLESLLARVTEENLHAEVETGPAVGMEAW